MRLQFGTSAGVPKITRSLGRGENAGLRIERNGSGINLVVEGDGNDYGIELPVGVSTLSSSTTFYSASGTVGAGRVVTITDTLNFDGNVYIDNSAGRVGINTILPSTDLHVDGGLRVTGSISDSSDSVGTPTNVLSSTGSGTSWVDLELSLNNYSSVVDPTVTDDTASMYEPGSKWINTSTGKTFTCVDNSVGAAVWKQENTDILVQDTLLPAAGAINFDAVKSVMNVRNIFTGSSLQVGQETAVFVFNNSGVTISSGDVVCVSGYDATNDAMTITLSIADTIENARVLGIATTEMPNNSTGLVTAFGRVNGLDTSSYSAGSIVYLSPTVAGGLTTTKPVIPIQVGEIGLVDASVGFIQVDIRELEKSIYGSFSHLVDQSYSANVTGAIAFDHNEETQGITHSTVTNNDEFTFLSGVYQATIEIQYTRTSGGGTDVLNVWLAKDTGSGFSNVADSNIKSSVSSAGTKAVTPLTFTFRVDDGDKIRFRIQVEDVNLILEYTPASGVAPNDIPETPSVIMNIARIGD